MEKTARTDQAESIDTLLDRSASILEEAIARHKPYAIVCMFSGGNDSRLAYHVAKQSGIKFDALVHARTGTGIRECQMYCQRFAEEHGERLIVADYGAGGKYVERLMTNGWPGRGANAHKIAYHILKATPIRKAISEHFRQRRRGRNVLMVNGVRGAESSNRFNNAAYGAGYENRDPAAKPNIWTNIVWDWDDKSKRDYLADQSSEQSIVAATIHRSGDCMCGTNQSMDEGEEAAFWFPEWGEWWRDMRRRVSDAGFPWDWAQHPPAGYKAKPSPVSDFMPACLACQNGQDDDVVN